ncbi:hypothetical protein AQUCO_00600387v1 [Aquilegia coerulea]|uniref:BHLH domain-containing protein n=1 Tax=Aquilegia coerulea TaxID=218851 RepID=A0A2G5EPD6_AQUCA|nr:hypothetical protein AQUCO_00600387v1 [Aquilegia coerulea]
MEIMDPTRDLQEDGEDDEEEFMRKDGSSQKGSGGSRGDGKNSGDGKANMPRSKHSETEQRRRSKINERFQILRDLLPPSDQKRDKASFLLEVIEYVQFLHEKLHKYESQHGNQEPSKLAPWRYSYWTSEGMVENSRLVKNGSGPGLMFAGKWNSSKEMQTRKYHFQLLCNQILSLLLVAMMGWSNQYKDQSLMKKTLHPSLQPYGRINLGQLIVQQVKHRTNRRF